MPYPTRGLVLWIAVLLLAACSSDDPPSRAGPDPAERLASARAATRGAGTARIEQSLVMEFPGGDGAATQVPEGTIDVSFEGFVDLAGRRARLEVTTKGEGLAGADALAGDTDVILDGRAMFMRSAFYQQLAPNHEPWLRISASELARRGASQLGQQDPLAFVEALRGVEGEVRELGDSSVRGIDATRYGATVNVEGILADLPVASRDSIAASFEQLGVSTFPIEAWLDEQHRLVKMSAEMGLEGATTRGGRLTVSIELFDFGVAFDLRHPPEDQVAEFSDVFGAVGG